MRKKLNDEEKKQKIGISINNDLNTIVENEMKNTGKKKSQIIEDAVKIFLNKYEKNKR